MIVIIIIGNTSSPNGDASRWNSTSHHQGNWTSDGEEVLGAKIGIAPNRGGVGVDRSGRHKTKWYIYFYIHYAFKINTSQIYELQLFFIGSPLVDERLYKCVFLFKKLVFCLCRENEIFYLFLLCLLLLIKMHENTSSHEMTLLGRALNISLREVIGLR